jgi:RimJ/RimL family protein N-acetyltransferase
VRATPGAAATRSSGRRLAAEGERLDAMHDRSCVLTTPRLALTPLAAADLAALHALWTSPSVREFLWDGEVIPRERTAAVIAESERLFAARRFGLWGARRHDSATLVGFGGLWHFRKPPELELLYGVGEGEEGAGLATELASAVVRYAFGELRFPELRASTDAGNAASVRVLEKLGFALERRATVGGLDTLFFSRSPGTPRLAPP